jgi:hypothetical protein
MAGGSGSAPEKGHRVLSPRISVATLGDRRCLVAEASKDLIAFLFLVLGCFIVILKVLSSNCKVLRVRYVMGRHVKFYLPHLL